MKKEKCHSQYGDYERPRIKLPDITIDRDRTDGWHRKEKVLVDAETLFRMRIKALLLNDDFKEFCLHPADRVDMENDVGDDDPEYRLSPIQKMERDTLSAWGDFPAWAKIHEKDYCLIALLFYGNIFQNNIGSTWTWFKNMVEIANNVMRPFPFQQIRPGTPAPQNSITVSFDPALRHGDLIQMFQGLLKKLKKGEPGRPPLSGYYELQPKAKWNEVNRFIETATHAAERRSRGQKTGRERMGSFYKEYPGNAESKRKTIHRDVQKGHNIAYWALRGIFPKTSNPSK